MDLLPELEQSSMIGDVHGVTVGIYKCRFLVGKIIPMKYDIYIYICGVFLWTVPSTPQIIAVLKKEHDDKPVDIGESYFWTSHKTSFTHQIDWFHHVAPAKGSGGIGFRQTWLPRSWVLATSSLLLPWCWAMPWLTWCPGLCLGPCKHM